MAITVTATQGGSTAAGMALRVMVLTQAAATQNGGSSATHFSSQTSFTLSVTTTQTGSRVYGASIANPNATATAAAATTLIDSIADVGSTRQFVTFKATSLTGTPGATTLGFTFAAAAFGVLAQLEVLTSGTLTEDASGPAVVSTTATTTVTTASFTPPPGALLVALVSSAGGAAVETMTVSDSSSLVWTEQVKRNGSGEDYAGVWTAQVPAPAGGAVSAQPGQTWLRSFHHPQHLFPPPAPAAAAVPSPATVLSPPPRQVPPHRARLGAAGALAAGILATGIGPPPVPAPHQPPVITHPPPHRALTRCARGQPPNAAQQVKAPVPVTVYSRRPHAVLWRGGRGAVPSALPQPFTPKTVYSRVQHRAQWRVITGAPPVVVTLGAAQPFIPVTVFRRPVHRAGWLAASGQVPAATRQPRIPATVFSRVFHRILWRGGLGSPAPPPPPFTIGALTAADKGQSVLTAAGASSALTASGATLATLTATDQRTGGPG